MAKEFVPPYLANPNHGFENEFLVNGFGMNQMMRLGNGGVNSSGFRRNKVGYNQGKRRNNNGRSTLAQREEVVGRTVFVSNIDQQVTKEQLAALFINCGQVVDYQICGDPNSVLRFTSIEFTDEDSAHAALTLSGTMLGFYAVKVLPSKTAIVPVNPHLLPHFSYFGRVIKYQSAFGTDDIVDNGPREGLDKFLRAESSDQETVLHYEFTQDYKVGVTNDMGL